MIVKTNTKFVIFLSFSIVLSLLVALIAIAIKSISDNQEEVLHLKEDSEIESLVYDMRDTAHTRALLLFRMASTEDVFDRDDLWIEFKTIAQDFIKAKESLQGMDSDHPNVKKYFEIALQSSGPGAKAQNETIRLLIDEDQPEEAKEVLTEKVIPLQRTVMSNFTQLLDSVRKNVGVSIHELSTENQNSILLITVLGVIAVFLGFIIAIYVTKHAARTEQAFIEQKILADEANSAKSMFLANMSHEIRSPLTAIIGFSDSILHRNISEDKKQDLMHRIARNTKHLHQVINDILDISKIEAGQLDIETVCTPLNDLFNELDSMMGLQASKKELDISIYYDYPLPEKIYTDPTRLKQILLNLTSNAIKFTNKGSITVRTSFDLKYNQMHFSVTDTGIGMSEEQAKRVFSAFSQADSSTTRQFGGTGLGLSISKQLVEKLGGVINCKSEIGKGSTFHFYINVGDININKMISNKEELELEAISQFDYQTEKLKGHVLVAEDTKDNQDLIEMYVTDTGANITIVENGKLAVEACEQGNYGLVFMDMQMPVMDGIEATTKIRASGNNIPIVSLTANAMKSDIDKCFDAGATEFLTKPIDVNRFNQVLGKYLDKDRKYVKREGHSMSLTPEEKKKKRAAKMEKFVNRFLDELPERLEKINDSNKEEKWDDVKMEAHKLKGLGTTMGYPEITEICADINNHCNDAYYDKVPELVEKLNRYSKTIL